MTVWIVLAVILWSAIWIGCGIVGAGYGFAYFQDEYPTLAERDYKRDRRRAIAQGIMFGPIGLFVSWQMDFTHHGWRLR